jgi:hypothetical protein
MAKHFQTWETYWLYGGSSGPSNGFDTYGHIEVYIDSQSQENNTTTLYINHYVYGKITNTNLGAQASITSKYRANKGSYGGTYKSVSKSITVYPEDGEKRFYIGQTWHTITHNADGTAKVYINGTIADSSKSTTSGFSKALPTIARMSTMTATRANIGEVSQLTITQRNTAYTHSIKYQFGELSGYILADGTTTDVETKFSETSIGFVIPPSFYEQIPGAKEGQVTLTITTYNGDTKIGSAQTTFYVDVADNEENRPNLTVSVVDINETTKALTDVDTKLIKGHSTASISYEASGNNFATITSVTLNGATVTISPVIIPYFSDEKIEVIATDSRTFTTKKTPDYTLIEYFDPTISIKAKRTGPTEDEILLSFSGNIFNKSFGSVMNELSLSWVYRIKNEEEWIIGGTFTKDTDYVIADNFFHSGTGESESAISLGELFSYENNYEIGVVYSDKLFGPVTTATVVSKGKPILNWNDKMVNVNGDLYINGEHFSGGDTLPIGAIVDYDGDTVPEGYEIVAETTYSTEEQKTGETWIDGRTIYRKVIQFGNIQDQYTKFVDHGIYNLDWFTDIKAVVKYNSSGVNYFYPIPFVGTATMFGASKDFTIRISDTQVGIHANATGFTTHTVIVTLEYIKTTD